MGGKKTNRETLRKKSAAWSNMVPIIETKKFEYRQSATRAIREYNQYQSQFVQDYAAIQLLYDNRDKLKVGQTYDLTVKFYAHRDGENGAVLAEGTVKLKYTAAAKIAFEGDPAKPELKGIFATFEAFSPSNKREYIDWINEAKTQATKEKRLTQAIEWMQEGKPRNWKYMKEYQ